MAAVAARLAGAGVPWRLAGSAALMLAGIPVRPGDVDVEVAAADATRAAAALGLPPPARADGGGWSSLRTQGRINGVEVDLSAGMVVTGPGGTLDAGDAATLAVRAPGAPDATVTVVAPGEALARAMVAGSHARTAKARAALDLLHGPARDRALAYAEERARSAAR